MNNSKLMLSERLLLCSVKHALTQSIHDPLFVSDEIIKNKNHISMQLIKKIQSEINIAILKNQISFLDIAIWDKLYDELQMILDKAGV